MLQTTYDEHNRRYFQILSIARRNGKIRKKEGIVRGSAREVCSFLKMVENHVRTNEILKHLGADADQERAENSQN
jgi:hypothetical protein